MKQLCFCPNKKTDEHVRIKIDLDELDEISAETKITYEKIKASHSEVLFLLFK